MTCLIGERTFFKEEYAEHQMNAHCLGVGNRHYVAVDITTACLSMLTFLQIICSNFRSASSYKKMHITEVRPNFSETFPNQTSSCYSHSTMKNANRNLMHLHRRLDDLLSRAQVQCILCA